MHNYLQIKEIIFIKNFRTRYPATMNFFERVLFRKYGSRRRKPNRRWNMTVPSRSAARRVSETEDALKPARLLCCLHRPASRWLMKPENFKSHQNIGEKVGQVLWCHWRKWYLKICQVSVLFPLRIDVWNLPGTK